MKSFSLREIDCPASIVEPGNMRGAIKSVRRENTKKVEKYSRPKADDSDWLLFYHFSGNM